MKYDNLLRYAVRILASYPGDIPLNNFLKNFFRLNPQMGSRDRKQVSEMVYCFFRLGHSLKNISTAERILTGLFLTNTQPEQILEHLHPEWHELVRIPLKEKIEIVRAAFSDFDPLEIFPWGNMLSKGIDHEAYCMSFLEKPRLFIRIRPGKEKIVFSNLQDHGIEYEDADPAAELPFRVCSFQGGTRLDDVFHLNRDAVVQDLSSQQTAVYLKPGDRKEFEAWDCCAGSGGKSILIADLYPGCHLTVSDIRESILNNLSIRFKEAGISPAHLFKADLTDLNDLPRKSFHFIAADLPCTGSGTWSRNPESLYFFKPDSVSNYRQRQEKILSNIVPRLNPDGILVYITCSVFAGENEQVTVRLLESGELKSEKEGMIVGLGRSADSMYAARFVRTR